MTAVSIIMSRHQHQPIFKIILDVIVNDVRLANTCVPLVVVHKKVSLAVLCGYNSTVLNVTERASTTSTEHHFPLWFYCLKW